MKKHLAILFCFAFLCAVPLAAQNRLKAGRTVAQAALSKPAAAQSGKKATDILRHITDKTDRLLKQSAPFQPKEVLKAPANNALAPNAEHTAKPDVRSADILRTVRAQQKVPALLMPKDHIFQAVSEGETNIRFSGTVFAVNYNGKREIYGAISTHIVLNEENDYLGVGRLFIAIVYHNGKPVRIPVQIVAVAPTSTLDIALVKFPESAEAFLKPLDIGNTQEGDTLYSIGFAKAKFQYIPNRQVLANLPFSIRTTLSLPNNQRSGLCGCPLLNAKNELVGIHSGSFSYQKENYSFATPARYLRDLVAAYHDPENAKIAFYIDDHIVIPIRFYEYPTSVTLLDEAGQFLAKQEITYRYSRDKVSALLKQYPQAKFLQMATKPLHWTPRGRALLMTYDWKDEFPATTYLYDLQAGKLVKTTEAEAAPLP